MSGRARGRARGWSRGGAVQQAQVLRPPGNLQAPSAPALSSPSQPPAALTGRRWGGPTQDGVARGQMAGPGADMAAATAQVAGMGIGNESRRGVKRNARGYMQEPHTRPTRVTDNTG